MGSARMETSAMRTCTVTMIPSDARAAHSNSWPSAEYKEMASAMAICRKVRSRVQKQPRKEPPQPCSSQTESCERRQVSQV